MRQARARHLALAITGAMLFDGEVVLCLIEGESAVLAQARLALAQALPSGHRRALHQGPVQGECLFRDWRYTEPEALRALCGGLDRLAEAPAQVPSLAELERLVNASDPL